MTTSIQYIGAIWCKTCKDIRPKTEELAKRFNVSLTILDYDNLSEEEKEDVMKVPTLTIFKNNEKVAKYDSNQVASLEKWLHTNINIEQTYDF